jgi:BASS family bile acid:Na+ symporter
VPPILPKKAGKLSTQGYPLALAATMSLLSIVVVQIGMFVLNQVFGRTFSMSPAAMVTPIVGVILAPLLVGMLVRYMTPGVAERLARPLSIVAGVLLTGAVLVLLGATMSMIYALASLDTLAAMVAFVLVGLVTGHVLGGPDPEHAGVLALATASRHPGIALAIASANFPLQRFGGIVILYLLVNAIVVIPYMKWRSAKRTSVAAVA